MNIILCYGYHPNTTAVYFERALRRQHNLHVVCTPGDGRLGYARNEDVHALIERGAVPRPDLLIFIETGVPFFPRGLEKLTCPTVGYLIDTHVGLSIRENYAYFFDHNAVCHKDYIPHFVKQGFPNVHWMPVGCDPEVHGEIPAERIYDVGFVGHLAPSQERRDLLYALERRFKLNDFRTNYPKEQLTQIYSRSKIVFNHGTHGDITMRVFEALAAGALLVSNPMQNDIDALLTQGEHYVQYTDERSLLEQVEYYLSHDAERQRIARAGQAAVLARHTYDHRVQDLIESVKAAPSDAASAKVRSMSASELRAAYGRVYSGFRLVDAAFDEFDVAWKAKDGRLAASKALVTAALRRFNATTKLTLTVRGLLRR